MIAEVPDATFAKRVAAVGRMLQVQPAAGLLRAFSAAFPDLAAAEGDFGAIEQDHLRLFVGLGMPLAPPWESAWSNDARLIFQRETLDVRYWYRSAGLQVARLHHEPDDHVGFEIEFIGLLLERGDAQDAAAFARAHPLAWIGRWSEAVSEHAVAPFYPALAREALALLESLPA